MSKQFNAAFYPSRLVEGLDRWYISIYFFDKKGRKVFKRPTFNLNRILNISDRRKRGKELVEKIDWWFRQGFSLPFQEWKVPPDFRISNDFTRPKKFDTNIVEAIQFVVKIKSANEREDSVRSYVGFQSIFIDFLERHGYAHLPTADIRTAHGHEFLDDLLVYRNVGARTYNSYLSLALRFFKMLEGRGYREKHSNIFADAKRKKPGKKLRRNFTEEEAKVVFGSMRYKYPLLFQALILEYACFIRPAELRRLKFSDINLEKGIVHVKSHQAKTHKDKFPVIPDSFRDFIDDEFFNKYPKNWFIFGKGFAPHESKSCGRNTMNAKHNRLLRALQEEGRLSDITGLTWYSWKDTGITDGMDFVHPTAIQQQADHSDLTQTMKYHHAPVVNVAVKTKFVNKLAPKKSEEKVDEM